MYSRRGRCRGGEAPIETSGAAAPPTTERENARTRERANALRRGDGGFIGGEAVAHAAHGDDRRAGHPALGELDAQASDVNVDSAAIARIGVAPDLLRELLAAHDLLGVR